MKLGYETSLGLSPMNIRRDQKHYIVEDLQSGEFFEMPEICIEAIGMMNQGQHLKEIEEVLKQKFPAEEVDILEFVSDLVDLGLVQSVDGETVSRGKIKAEEGGGLLWIPQRLGVIFFNPVSTFLYCLAFLASMAILIVKPEMFPVYQDIFVFDLMMYNIFAFLGMTFILVLFHEFGHVLAMRAEGLPTGIELGHRLFFIVLETDMSKVWSLPAKRRYRLYMAGMYVDALVLFAALFVQLLAGGQGLASDLAKMAVFSTFIRILYQCCVYMKTDLYYVLENYSGSYNLMENGQNFLRRWLPFIPEEKASSTFKGEEKLVRPYAIFYLSGVAITISIILFYNLPLIVHAGIIVSPGFLESPASILFWDAVVFFLQFVIMFALLGYSWTKKYRLRA